jgi:hypothetical protein
MEIPAEFSGRVFKLRRANIDKNPKILSEIKKDFPDCEIGNLYEVKKNGCLEETFAIEFETEEDYTAFRLKYGRDDV